MSTERWVSSMVVLGGFAASVFLFHSPDSVAGGPYSDAAEARIAQGFAISPVLLDLKGKDPALVGLGSYIVNAPGGCNDCHTEPAYEPGHDPFSGGDGRVNVAGYMKGGRDMGNGIFSRDLTPDAQGLPAGMTLEQFVHVMRTGDDLKQPGRLLQMMPWPAYRNMVDVDQRAVYEYLSAIRSSHATQ